jgi:hypothetical protein
VDASLKKDTMGMPPTMSQTSLQELLQLLRYDYRQTPGKGARGAILDQWCRASGHERKYAIKVLRGQRGLEVVGARREGPPPERGGSAKVYGPALVGVLKAIWLQNEQPCGKRLIAVLPLLVPSWERHYGELDATVRSGLLKISRTQIDRVLAPFRTRSTGKRPAPGYEVRRQVPLRTGPWNVSGPGWVEVDTVAHCGGSMRGCFAWSACMTDICSTWTEVRTAWNRSDRVILARLRESEASLPFALRGYDSDNGGEVLNGAILKWLRERPAPVEVTRSRPYRKNDNAHVEQKNLTHIRLFLGWDRIGEMGVIEPLNALMADWSLWNNLYSPALKLLSKERHGARVTRKWEKEARTPAQRVLAYAGAGSESRKKVEAALENNDPITLKRSIEAQLAAVYQQLAAPPSAPI